MGLFDGWATTAAAGIESAANILMNERTNAQNKALTEKQWSREDKAHQREVEDMIAAGLNPLLSAGGNGASSSSPIPLRSAQMANISGAVAQDKNIKLQKDLAEKQKQIMDTQDDINRHNLDIAKERGSYVGESRTLLDTVIKSWDQVQELMKDPKFTETANAVVGLFKSLGSQAKEKLEDGVEIAKDSVSTFLKKYTVPGKIYDVVSNYLKNKEYVKAGKALELSGWELEAFVKNAQKAFNDKTTGLDQGGAK